MLQHANQPKTRTPLWRKLAKLGPELGAGGHWRPVRSPDLQFDPPPEATALGEAEIVEGEAFALRGGGDPESSGFEYFLDGIEMTRISGYVGVVPLVHGYVASVIRRRVGRTFSTWAVQEDEVLAFDFKQIDPRRLIDLGFPEAGLIDSEANGSGEHPMRTAELGRIAIKKRRAAIEADLARRWAASSLEDGWLLVDGRLAIEPTLLRSGRAIGLVKSHRTQYLDSAAMSHVLGMRGGQRSSVFKPVRPAIGEVYSWYLRLRSAAGQDIYWALARIEGRVGLETVEAADEISRWLLAETAPLAMPDPRWHVLIYPIRDCEQFLRARMPTLAIG